MPPAVSATSLSLFPLFNIASPSSIATLKAQLQAASHVVEALQPDATADKIAAALPQALALAKLTHFDSSLFLNTFGAKWGWDEYRAYLHQTGMGKFTDWVRSHFSSRLRYCANDMTRSPEQGIEQGVWDPDIDWGKLVAQGIVLSEDAVPFQAGDHSRNAILLGMENRIRSARVPGGLDKNMIDTALNCSWAGSLSSIAIFADAPAWMIPVTFFGSSIVFFGLAGVQSLLRRRDIRHDLERSMIPQLRERWNI